MIYNLAEALWGDRVRTGSPPYYRREAFTYLDLEERIGTAIERVDSFGVRGFTVLRGDGSVISGARLDVYVGYVPELDRVTLSIGVTTGGF